MNSSTVSSPKLTGPWRFRLEQHVGKGGTADVWRAVDRTTGKPVALKVALDERNTVVLVHEAEVLMTVDSPHVPALVDLGRVPEGVIDGREGAAYVALGWLDGRALDPRSALASRQRHALGLVVARDVGEALSQLHDAGLAHGDVKPQNILIGGTGATGPASASLVDLGFSTAIELGSMVGATPRYLAPEVAQGRVSVRALDLWAMGLVLGEIVSEQVASSADPLSALRGASLPPPFDVWCKALTAPEPGARPSASWLAGAARQRLGGDASARATDESRRVRTSYLRVRRDDIRRASRAREYVIPDGACSWLRDAIEVTRTASVLRGERFDAESVVALEPLGAAERARWLVALVGSAAAAWQLEQETLRQSEEQMAQALERLASLQPARSWSARDVICALETDRKEETSFGSIEAFDEVDFALELTRRPVAAAVVDAAEHKQQRGELSGKLALLLADALRSMGEAGRALVCLDKVEEPAAAALGAEVMRRMDDKEGAYAAAGRAWGAKGESGERARAVVARLKLDAGEPDRAMELVDKIISAGACEVRALAHLALGHREYALREIANGMALATDEETRARLECVRGVEAHGRGDAGAAHSAFSRAAEHAARAGAVIEEATFRTNVAAAAADAGLVAEALDAAQRAALLWEHLGRSAQWAYSLMVRANVLCLVGAWCEARAVAIGSRDRACEARDVRAEAYAWMTLADASEPRGQTTIAACRQAHDLLATGSNHEDVLRAMARLLLHGGEIPDDEIRRLDRVATTPMSVTSQCEWWGARAQRWRDGDTVGRSAEITANLVRLARVPAAVASKGPALHAGCLLAQQAGDGEAVRLFSSEQARLASHVVLNTPAQFRENLSGVPWIAGAQLRAEPGVSVDQVRNLEVLVRALARRDSLRSLLEQALDALILWTGVERGLLLLRAPDNRLVVRAARNLERTDLRADQMKLSQSLAQRALATGEPVVAMDAAGEISEVHESVHALGLRSVVAVPLLARGRSLGVAYLDDRIRAGAFGPQELAWIKLIAVVAAVAIADARDQLLLRRAARRASRAEQQLADVLARREAELTVASTELARMREERATRYRYDAVVGTSEPVQAMLELVDRITPTSLPVLIVGESGSGKELVARALHRNGPRGSGPFVSENCSAIPETLLESTLFGHVRGAFTNADRPRIGLFEAADRGTLLLDEIGEMSMSMQSKLLRTLQDGEVHPLGSSRPRKVDVRVIAATHRDLATLVKEGRFREDLFYRLNVISIGVPPLRERADDIPILMEHFVKRYGGGRRVRTSPEATARLTSYDWPGNVRQLENEIRRALVLCEEVIRLEHLSPTIVGSAIAGLRPTGLDIRSRVDALERELVGEALSRTRGNQTQAARMLGLSRFGLQKMIRRLGIQDDVGSGAS